MTLTAELGISAKGYSFLQKCGYITLPMTNIGSLKNALLRIDDPSARKIVIMSKWERGEISPREAERLIQEGGLANA